MENEFFVPSYHFFDCKNTFSGSHKGMNYKILKPDENKKLHVLIWYGDFCITVSDVKAEADFDFSTEGLEAIENYLKEQFDAMESAK